MPARPCRGGRPSGVAGRSPGDACDRLGVWASTVHRWCPRSRSALSCRPTRPQQSGPSVRGIGLRPVRRRPADTGAPRALQFAVECMPSSGRTSPGIWRRLRPAIRSARCSPSRRPRRLRRGQADRRAVRRSFPRPPSRRLPRSPGAHCPLPGRGLQDLLPRPHLVFRVLELRQRPDLALRLGQDELVGQIAPCGRRRCTIGDSSSRFTITAPLISLWA